MMRPTPQSIPISALHQEAGAQDLVRSEKMRPYLELLKADIGGQNTAPYQAALAELQMAPGVPLQLRVGSLAAGR